MIYIEILYNVKSKYKIRMYLENMEIKHVKIHTDDFDEIIEDIRQRNLSRNNLPKLIVKNGLSMIYDFPAMLPSKIILNKLNEKHKSATIDFLAWWYDGMQTVFAIDAVTMKLPAAELRGISPRPALLIISLLRSRAAGN